MIDLLQRRLRRQPGQNGFTLIELLVVIIILGVLAAVVVFAVGGVGDKGEDSAERIDRRTLQTAEEAFFAQNGRYATEADLVVAGLLSEEASLHDVALNNGPCNGRPAGPDSCYEIFRSIAPDTVNVAMLFDNPDPAPLRQFRTGVDYCEPLFGQDENFQSFPQLALSITHLGSAPAPSPDSGTGDKYSIALRPGIKFHDGSTLAASDVVASFQRIVSLNLFGALGLNANSTVAIDPLTVEVTTKVRNLQFPSQMSSQGASIIKAGSDPQVLPVCTGPYKFVSYTPATKLVVQRFEDYWGEKARVRQLNFLVNADANARLLALQSGQVDLAREIPRAQVSTVDVTPGLKTIHAKQGTTILMELNSIGPAATNNLNADPILADVRVRKALAEVIDRNALVADGLSGQANEQVTLSPPSVLGASASLVTGFGQSPDAAAATALLDSAGWSTIGLDGVRLNGASRRLSLQLYFDPSQFGAATINLVAAHALSVGIEIVVNQVPNSTVSSRRISGNYDIAVTQTNQGDASPSALNAAWSYQAAFLPPGHPTSGGGSTFALGRWAIPTSGYDGPGADNGKTYETLVAEAQMSTTVAATADKAAKAQHVMIDQDATYIILAGIRRIWGATDETSFRPIPQHLVQKWNRLG